MCSLSGSKLKAASTLALAPALAENKSLTTVNLHSNDIDDDGLKALLATIAPTKSLKALLYCFMVIFLQSSHCLVPQPDIQWLDRPGSSAVWPLFPGESQHCCYQVRWILLLFLVVNLTTLLFVA